MKQSPLRYCRNGAVALVKAKGLSAVIEERLRTDLPAWQIRRDIPGVDR